MCLDSFGIITTDAYALDFYHKKCEQAGKITDQCPYPYYLFRLLQGNNTRAFFITGRGYKTVCSSSRTGREHRTTRRDMRRHGTATTGRVAA